MIRTVRTLLLVVFMGMSALMAHALEVGERAHLFTVDSTQRDISMFEKLNAQVLGISVDDIKTHQRFSSRYDISFPLISDPEGELQQHFDSGRVLYVIDQNGVVRFKKKGMPKNEKLLGVLKELNK